jgi:CheY-like chemotaxis protein
VLSPEQAGSLLLQRIWRQLPPGIEPERLVLTAPIDGYRGYRRWLASASEALAVAEVALVDEPTAAAIGAGLPPGSRVLVVDLGGGTVDLSLVALEGFRRGNRYDLVFCDLKMPGLTGQELYHALQEVAPEQAERIVFMTANQEHPPHQAFLSSIANLYIEKPFDHQRLRELALYAIR